MFPLKPLECCFSSLLRVIVLLEGEPPSQSQISERLKQVSLKNFPVFSAIHHSFNSDQFPSPCWWKTSTQHDATTTMLHCGDGVLRVMRGVGFVPDVEFSLMAKKLHLVSSDQSTLFHTFEESPTCLLASTKHVCLFLSGHYSIKPSSMECMA